MAASVFGAEFSTASSRFEYLLGGVQTGYIIDQGEFEVELVSGFEKDDDAVTDFILELEYAPASWLALEVELPYLWLDRGNGLTDTEGLGDLEFAMKFLLHQTSRSSTALLCEVEFPTGDAGKGTGSGGYVSEFSLLTSLLVREGLFLHAGGGVEFMEGEGYEESVFTLALDQRVTDEFNVQFAVEAEWENSDVAWVAGAGAEFEIEVPGLPEFEVGCGIYKGLDENAPDWGTRVAIEIEF